MHNLQNIVDISHENVDSTVNTVDKQGGIVDNSVHNLGNQPCTAVAVRYIQVKHIKFEWPSVI